MTDRKRSSIGVVAAEVNSIEQREIMKGLIKRAQELGKKTVVFSNIYNPYEYDEALDLENSVYELIFSQELCGLILISESILNEKLREKIRAMLEQRQDIPVVIIGIYVPTLDFPNVRFINSSDEDDMEEITNHLLEKHGFTKIDILTGFEGNGASEDRVRGYRRALESHGIEFDPSRVHYGNFWTDSGEKLANAYIRGDLPMPEGVVCGNDYMAFGMLDTFLQYHVRVPEDITVAGYEFIHERVYHSPLLSTFQRGRQELGISSVDIVAALSEGKEPEPFKPPKGIWISGASCPCGTEQTQLHDELGLLRTQQQYNKWNVLGTMEQQLTLCGTLDELIKVLSAHQFNVRWVQNMFLCLFDNWYDTKADTPTEMMSCRSVMPWHLEKPAIRCTRYEFDSLYAFSPDNAVHYYLPLFFEKHLFGYFVLEYHNPDTYDDIFRNWMKSISIGLTFLCMKNDIRYLLQCQNLSDERDSLTGLYNQRGTIRALGAQLTDASKPIYAIAIRLDTPDQLFTPDTQDRKTALLQKISEVFRMVGLQDCVCGRIDVQTLLCAGIPVNSSEELVRVTEKLRAVLLHHTNICRSEGGDAIMIRQLVFDSDMSAEQCISEVNVMLEDATEAHILQQRQPHADKLFAVRNGVYALDECDTDNICRRYSFSSGYFRQIYKDFFGVSFHQDVIRARVFLAMYLLTTTVQSAASIAESCGYDECNYFLRQFQKVTGMTPGKFRRQVP
ncbi:MAG: substrate-binding domain-containing protein [Oscillospiraceae bacterium]|nr:substrate-binding domain-containing protein [Oscillospiraceae bacterium]